ncbi:ABC transporter permease [soil metagenome]
MKKHTATKLSLFQNQTSDIRRHISAIRNKKFMFKNYFKTAWRNLLKNKFYTVINIAGLTLGLAVGILILLWVNDETSFDAFHKDAANIYKLENRVGTGESTQIWENTVAPIGKLAKQQLPEIKESVTMSYNNTYSLFKSGDKVFNEQKAFYTDAAFFSIFDFHLIKGNADKPFINDHSLVLTETTARRYFGDVDPIGKIIVADDSTSFAVTGVIKDFASNSTIQADMFMPIDLLGKTLYAGRQLGDNMDHDFRQFNYITFLLLKPYANLASLQTKIRTIHLNNKADDTDIAYLLQNVTNMHLYKSDGTDGGMETVRMFTIIALLILVIACINYVNLSTARSMLRAKEISMRKIVGAAKIQLFLQFIVETAVLFIIATILAIGLIYLLIPTFNNIAGKQLLFEIGDPNVWVIIAVTILVTLAISSIYPAILLSSFEPLKALKGKISVKLSDAIFRKVLVVTQFAFSIVLIAGTFIISRQLNYIHNKSLGYDKDHVFSFYMRGMAKHYDAVKADLLSRQGVTGVTRAGSNIVNIGGQTGSNEWDGKLPGQTMMVRPLAMDKDFASFFKLNIIDGAGFTGAVADSTHYILNETAVLQTGLKNPIGKRFKLWGTEGTIIGVVKDFHFASMKKKIEPVVCYYFPNDMGTIYIKTSTTAATQAIAAAEQEWKSYNAGFSFNYSFLDETFNELYKTEQRTGSLFNAFAAIAIFISCLGLFGLATFTAQVRTREIGVRKVIGASVASIIALLAKDFIKLVLIALVISIPVAWFVMNKWLQDFAYKTNISWTIFAITGLIAVAIALLTISFQSVKAAIANPVKSLRTE